jgi:hypothetical protein
LFLWESLTEDVEVASEPPDTFSDSSFTSKSFPFFRNFVVKSFQPEGFFFGSTVLMVHATHKKYDDN